MSTDKEEGKSSSGCFPNRAAGQRNGLKLEEPHKREMHFGGGVGRQPFGGRRDKVLSESGGSYSAKVSQPGLVIMFPWN